MGSINSVPSPESVDHFNQDLFSYLDSAPTPFHGVREAIRRLKDAGFERLDEADQWQLEQGKQYYVERNASSLIAFTYQDTNWDQSSYRLFGAHCDSPCLKVKPNAEVSTKGYLKLGVEVYGGVLLNPWFDRDLSLAGRLVLENDNDKASTTCLINFDKAIAFIPSLAIHLDREANSKRTINAQKDIPPVLLQHEAGDTPVLEGILLEQVAKEHPDLAREFNRVLDFELSFYDVQNASYIGLKDDFFASARLDNLLSCYVGLQALIDNSNSDQAQNALIVINDHEEVGSQTAQGAQGAFLSQVFERICGGSENASRCLARSMLISADNAHGVHPNFPEKHDANHGPLLNAGPVIKVNANQRYATNSLTSARFKQFAEQADAPIQSFVVRTDMGCGSTIGPLTSAELGIQTIDVGVPTFGMHSIRESAGRLDAWYLYEITKHFFAASKVL